MTRTRVYIAGPYTKPDPEANTRGMMAVWDQLWKIGYQPMCPLWSHYQHLAHPLPYEDWMAFDLAWLPLFDAVLRLPGASSGADKEVVFADTAGIPVFYSVEKLQQFVPPERPPRGGDPRFYAILDEMSRMHARKAHDYGLGEDCLTNVRSSEEFGVPGWIGCAIRANDKMVRLKAFAEKGSLKNEGVEDSLADLACYAILALILFREKNGD